VFIKVFFVSCGKYLFKLNMGILEKIAEIEAEVRSTVMAAWMALPSAFVARQHAQTQRSA